MLRTLELGSVSLEQEGDGPIWLCLGAGAGTRRRLFRGDTLRAVLGQFGEFVEHEWPKAFMVPFLGDT